jgi:circadian clock protein KaiB
MKKTPGRKTSARLRVQKNGGSKYDLCLYVASDTHRSSAARANLKRICIDHLRGKYRLKVIDLAKRPELARRPQILAIPTLVRRLPPPIRKIIGDLSDTDRVLVGLDLKP